MTKIKKVLRAVLILTVIASTVLLVNFLPTFSLKNPGMKLFEGKWLNVYYETEQAAAEDVFRYADAETEAVAQKLGFAQKADINVYIYDDQADMQRKKYGYIGPMLNLDWYIGDNMGTDVILTSPANPGKVHTYDNNKYAVLHEIVHAYVSVINPGIDLWLTEGVALYLSNGEPFSQSQLSYMSIPTYENTRTANPITFSNCGGYTFAHTYIEYLDKTYGWDRVLQLIGTEDYPACFGKSQEDIYHEWTAYLRDYPQ